MTGKTAKIPLQTSPKVAAKVVTDRVNKAPTNIRQGRSFNLPLGGEVVFRRGSRNGVITRETMAMIEAMPRSGEVTAKVSATPSQATKAESNAKGQLQ